MVAQRTAGIRCPDARHHAQDCLPGLHGVKAWEPTRREQGSSTSAPRIASVFASGAVLVASNSTRKFSTNLGAVAFGYHQTICRDMTLRYSAHAKVYTFTANNKGQINHRSKTKNLF
jgi:hypothetical protein